MQDRRLIPSIEQLRQRPAVRALEDAFGPAETLDALRAAAADVRAGLTDGRAEPISVESLAARIESIAASQLATRMRPSLQPVINATGVVLHTNLGRAPLADAALRRVLEIGRGYSNLEYDLEAGARGRRDVHAEALLCRLTGAEAAVIVNNNAAATLLVLAALAAGREVIVSRGELVEIGGGFRVPDVMAQSGAVLREVGTTNKTRVTDYAAAISDRTALVLRVHPSNFRIEGFTERPALHDLVALGRRFSIPLVEDLGSGHLAESVDHPLSGHEASVAASVAAGVDVCCFSGDKLLGGPQAGIIVGRRDLVGSIRGHPMMRALRADKMTYAALEATLGEYAAGRASQTVPVQRMLSAAPDTIRQRADTLVTLLNEKAGWRATVVGDVSAVGGGSAPRMELPTWVISVRREGLTAADLEARLRQLSPPIIARTKHDAVLLDLRTVLPEDDAIVAGLLGSIG